MADKKFDEDCGGMKPIPPIKEITMDKDYDKEIAAAIKRGKQLDKEIAKSK